MARVGNHLWLGPVITDGRYLPSLLRHLMMGYVNNVLVYLKTKQSKIAVVEVLLAKSC